MKSNGNLLVKGSYRTLAVYRYFRKITLKVDGGLVDPREYVEVDLKLGGYDWLSLYVRRIDAWPT